MNATIGKNLSKRKSIIRFLWIIALLPVFIILYLIVAFVLSMIPVNTSFQEPEQGIDIYIKSNGVHTDIVVPVSTKEMDWRIKIDTSKFKKTEQEQKYIAFGWGDKGFYLYTPTWADLKFSTAFKAAFWLSTSAMHVTYYENTPVENELTKKIRITADEYQKLIKYIDQSFQKNEQGKYILIDCCHYKGINDNFYEGVGVYNLFKTCNTWTNNGLKTAGIRTALWGPFDWSILYHLE